MTDVPEHLLQRSRERRAALGLGGADAGGAAPTPPAGDSPAAAAPAAKAPAKAAKAAAPVAAAPPPPTPPYIKAANSRPKIPVWAVPVLAFLPVWGLIYGFGLAEPVEELEPVLALGQEIYIQCAGCHQAQGQGGPQGRPLAGEVELTFPDWRDHAAWVRAGSDLVGKGEPYGDPDREGGQHISQEGYGPMPGFPDLTDEEIIAVVRYEREVLSGEEEPELAVEGAMEEALEAGFEGGGANSATGGGGAEGESAAEGGSAEGGSAEGGSAEGGSAEGGSADGGSADGGMSQDPAGDNVDEARAEGGESNPADEAAETQSGADAETDSGG